MRLGLRIAVLLTGLLLTSKVFATTYYVDYTNGNDSWDGLPKDHSAGGNHGPWKYAPGMNGSTGTSASTSPAPGDKVIFKGCVTWPNSAFVWTLSTSGSAGNIIYFGVDKTWWDATVPGCSSAWNRPVFNLGNLPANNDSMHRVIRLTQSYVTLDNFEITNTSCLPSPGNGTTNIFDWGDNSETNVVVTNMYVHGWNNPAMSVGTGNTTAGSYTITNFVPFSYSQSPSAAWVAGIYAGNVRLQSVPGNGNIIPIGNNNPTLTGVSGSNPYTLTFSSNAGPASATTGTVIQVGGDYCRINGGGAGPQTNDVFSNSVIDGSDTAEVKWNPYGDCGLSEGNNNFCIASATVGWRQPNIWRNNVIRYVSNAFVGSCQEWSGNLIEYIRLETDPSGHTNGIECTDDQPVNSTTLFYNNVIRHMNNPNPNTPSGRQSVGAAPFWPIPNASENVYVFNNVSYDAIQNVIVSRAGTAGTMRVFSNTFACGNDWAGYTQACQNRVEAADTFQNNLTVTTNPNPWGTGATYTSNVAWTPTQATRAGFNESRPFAYSPPNNNCTSVTPCTVGTGTSAAALCNALSGAGFSAAATACLSDTNYGALYNTANHTAVTGTRPTLVRPSGAWDVGAYQFSTSGNTQVQPPTGLTAIVQ